MQKGQALLLNTLHTLMQLWNEQFSSPIGYCYVPATSGFAAADIYQAGKNNSDKIRPWFKR
jgi:hypothetical protein